MSAAAADYTPFIEQGKTFQYQRAKQVIQTYGATDPTQDFIYLEDFQPFTLKIDGTEEIDGQQWAVCVAYDGFSLDRSQAQQFCHLRETAEGDLYVLFTRDDHGMEYPAAEGYEAGKEKMVHSLANPTTMDPLVWACEGVQYTPSTYATPSGRQLSAVTAGDAGWQLVESLGVLIPDYATFLGVIPLPTCWCADYLSLYRIQGADGELLYENTANAPIAYWPTAHPGKTWRYSWSYWDDANDCIGYRKWELQIHGAETKNDIRYYQVYAYFDGSTTPDQDKPYCWIREDAAGNVYALANPEYQYTAFHGLMNEHYAEDALVQSYTDYAPQDLKWGLTDPSASDYVAPNGRHLQGLSDSSTTLIEGVGYISTMGLPATIFGYDATTTSNPLGKTYLYEVEDYDGTVLYYNSSNDRVAGVSDVTVDSSTTPVEYYDLQGRRVTTPTHGLYLRRQGSTTTKEIK